MRGAIVTSAAYSAPFDMDVLRLVRVAIGDLVLGQLPKGKWRELSRSEVKALRP
jgi:23S rRNA pseudouridine2605 synthase